MYKLKIRELVFVSLFIALITVGTFIRIPVGTDVYTLQFLFTLMAGLVLGARLGALAVGTYVLMGLLGIPVFASGGGPAYVLQPTFGYLVGFIVQAYVCGKYSRGIKIPKFKNLLIANSIGMAICVPVRYQLLLFCFELHCKRTDRFWRGCILLRCVAGDSGFYFVRTGC